MSVQWNQTSAGLRTVTLDLLATPTIIKLSMGLLKWPDTILIQSTSVVHLEIMGRIVPAQDIGGTSVVRHTALAKTKPRTLSLDQVHEASCPILTGGDVNIDVRNIQRTRLDTIKGSFSIHHSLFMRTTAGSLRWMLFEPQTFKRSTGGLFFIPPQFMLISFVHRPSPSRKSSSSQTVGGALTIR